MKNELIRWNRGNEISLKIAINTFNKRIKELEKQNLTYLPETLKYSDVKSRILSESELKRYIKNLNKFKSEGATEKYVTKAR